jgi:hypothetical protein
MTSAKASRQTTSRPAGGSKKSAGNRPAGTVPVARPYNQDGGKAGEKFCAGPGCRKRLRRRPGPGRPRTYCSIACRRAAERERAEKRWREAHYDLLVAMGLDPDYNLFEAMGIDPDAYERDMAALLGESPP